MKHIQNIIVIVKYTSSLNRNKLGFQNKLYQMHKIYQVINVYHNAMYHGFFEDKYAMVYALHQTS